MSTLILFSILETVERKHPGILRDGRRIWNTDETAINVTFGERIKVFGPSNTHHGGFVASTHNGAGKHITAVIAVSADGLIAPPFFIIAGKKVVQKWIDPLDPSFREGHPDCDMFTRPEWMPADATIRVTENGSMEMAILPAFIKHLDNFVRNVSGGKDSYLLTVDVHGSRNGYAWLEQCEEVGCEVVQSPANTSQFLQLCDQMINKRF